MSRTLVLLVTLLVAVAGWMVYEVEQAPMFAPASDPPAPPLARPPVLSVQAAAPAAMASAPRSAAPGETEVCGSGPVKWAPRPAGDMSPPPVVQDAERRAVDALKRLTGHADARVRAGALFFAARRLTVDAEAPRFNVDAAALDALATLAAGSSDPAVYWAGVAACGLADGDGLAPGCQRLNLEQWARIEPDNAAPWLAIAGRAQQRNDAAAVAEALHRASLAPRLDARWAYLPALLLPALPPDTPPLERGLAAMAALGAQSTAPFSSAPAVLPHCAAPALADANRRQACDALGRLMAERSGSFHDRRLGLRLADALDWPPERQEALATELDGAMAAASRATVPGDAPFGCESLARAERWFAAAAQKGEIGAALDAVRGSGKTLAQLAAEHRAANPRPGASAASAPR